MLSIGAGASSASAATYPAGCANLQSTIDEVALQPGHGAGDTVVLSGLCDASSLKSAAGVTLPAESNFSIEGAPGTTSGFDGAGVTAPMLGSGGGEVGTMAISHLTFQHASSKSQGAALAVRARTGLTLSGDAFLENTAEAPLGGAVFAFVGGPGQAGCPPAGTVALTLTASTFRANRLVASKTIAEGGGAWLLDSCETAANVITGNTFEGNRIEASESHLAFGAGLDFVGPGTARPGAVTQIGNVFDSNAVAALSGAGDYGGGGEWLEGASLTSVGDRFSRNTASGTSGAPNWSWGAGLGVINTTCNSATPTESVLENAVVEGNVIVGGVPADSGGAGIYVGCTPSLSSINHLTVLDSTITENAVDGGGVTGIEGNSSDHLVLANSILADQGGPEIGGFEGPGGSVSVSYSDVCAPSSSAPLTGTGNICANPLLADNGNPASYDIHETAASPTIDAGSNALVPAGLATDFFGTPRTTVESFHPGCDTPSGTRARVDMGAAEYPPPHLRFGRRQLPDAPCTLAVHVPEGLGERRRRPPPLLQRPPGGPRDGAGHVQARARRRRARQRCPPPRAQARSHHLRHRRGELHARGQQHAHAEAGQARAGAAEGAPLPARCAARHVQGHGRAREPAAGPHAARHLQEAPAAETPPLRRRGAGAVSCCARAAGAAR
jgi:hypothetical protein